MSFRSGAGWASRVRARLVGKAPQTTWRAPTAAPPAVPPRAFLPQVVVSDDHEKVWTMTDMAMPTENGYEDSMRMPDAQQEARVYEDKKLQGLFEGLQEPVPRIPCEYLYDAKGSEIYERIVETPEYYLPKAEDALLTDPNVLQALLRSAGPAAVEQVVVELGAGNSQRGYGLLDLLARRGEGKEGPTGSVTYVPGDISPTALERNKSAFAEHFQGRGNLSIRPVVGTHLELLEAAAELPGRKTMLFLGSSLGNFEDEDVLELFTTAERGMMAQDRFVLGLDRAPHAGKGVERVELAYNDAAGHTARFTQNGLAHVARLLGLDFGPEEGWRHDAGYDAARKAIVTHLESPEGGQVVRCAHTGEALRSFRPGERIFMEQSRKWSLEDVQGLARRANLEVAEHYASEDYFLLVLRRNVYAEALQRSREVFSLAERIHGGLAGRPIGLRNPYSFYLGHIAAFADKHVLQRPGLESMREAYERGVDPDVDDPQSCHRHSSLDLSEGISRQALDRYVAETYEAWQARWLADRSGGEGAVVSVGGEHSRLDLMSLEHQQMHNETLIHMLQEDQRQRHLLGEPKAEQPILKKGGEPAATCPERWKAALDRRSQRSSEWLRSSASSANAAGCTMLHVPGGPAELGASLGQEKEQGFVWDNELPGQGPAYVEGFHVARLPVTNREYLDFVEASGGALRPPLQWERRPAPSSRGGWEWHVHSPLGGPMPLSGEAGFWPAIVTHEEALAYAKWKSARLLSEAEYARVFVAAGAALAREEGAAAAAPLAARAFRRAAARGNNDWRFCGFLPVGSCGDAPHESLFPIFDLAGNGWEWTSSVFEPLKGFKPMAEYDEYSQDFFDGKHFVCVGASPFTSLQTIRPSFRNFYQARYPHLLTKFRLAYDDDQLPK